MAKAVVVLGAHNLGAAIIEPSAAQGWSAAGAARSEDQPRALAEMGQVAQAVWFLVNQRSRALTHELVVTPAGERWMP